MARKKTLTGAETLELYRISLDNAEKQPTIASAMAELGYDSAVINQGKVILTEARQTYDVNRIEDDETSEAYALYSDARDALGETYGLHRKKAKVVFKNDPIMLDRLELTGSMPKAYIGWLEKVKTFYSGAVTDPVIQSKLARLKVSLEELNDGNRQINELETARGEYLREKGESQEATKIKDMAIKRIDDWMSDFYVVAKIVLEDKAQLLESMGKLVRS